MNYLDGIALLAVACLVILLLCKHLGEVYNYWKIQGVPFVPPQPLVGSVEWKKPLHETETDRYNCYGRIYGRFEARNPVLSVADPDILRRIFVKDFHMFPNRRDMKFHDPIMDNTLFVLEGEAWRRVRNIVTPTFTASKLRRMMPLLNECCDLLVQKLSESSQMAEVVDCQEIFEGFVLCAIGRCAFGMTLNTMKNPQSTFIEKSKKLFVECLSWRTHLTILCPAFMKLFRIKLLNPETTGFYRQIIMQVLEERKKRHLITDDFLQMLLDAEDSNNNGQNTVCATDTCNAAKITPTVPKPAKKVLSHDELLAQCITFFIAGFDPTASLLSHVIYQLAVNEDYQNTVVEEMNDALDKHNGMVCYEALSEMKFMEAVLNECMRLCPAMVRYERRTSGDYVIEEKNIHLRKGMLVSIPVYAIHHDAEWYPEPEVFKPERFYEPDPNRPQYVHFPFGSGPRICVGMRFVMLQVKLCLTKILLNFQVLPAPSTPKTLGYTENRNILKVNKVEVLLKARVSS